MDETWTRPWRHRDGVPDSGSGAGEHPDGLLLSRLLSGSVSVPLMLKDDGEVENGDSRDPWARDFRITFWKSLILGFVACRGPPFGPRFWRVLVVVHCVSRARH